MHGMFSLKNKKQNRVVFALALFLFSSGIFFLLPGTVHADAWGAVKEVVGGAIGGVLDSTVGLALRGLLYAVFVLLGWFTSVAVTLFEWCINPDYISGNGGLLNKQSVYANWKFIRDFFNLFFILTLLYTAFTIVFQVAKNYKQTLLSIILAAMFVNFSFPITRVIIDVTNVPMYYFVNQMMAKEEGKSAFGNFLGASKIQDALIPESYSVATGSTTQLLMAIVMLFMFMIALLVFSVLMVVRLVAIVMLLIFSSVGFAASVIPGMQEYGDKWWKALWQYSLFGPTSMLMMLIATRFFEEIGKDGTRGQFMQVAISNATPAESGMIASVAMFSIPIIMMWFAIGIGMSSSIVGAGAVVGLGYAAIKGTGRFVTRTPAAFAYRKYEKKVAEMGGRAKYLSPTVWKDSIKNWRAESEKRDKAPVERASAVAQDNLNNLFGRHTNHAFAVDEHQAAAAAKEITDVSTNSSHVMTEMDSFLKSGEKENVQGALMVLAKNNDLNDLLMAKGAKYEGIEMVETEQRNQETGEVMKDATGKVLMKKVPKISPKNFSTLIQGVLKDAGVEDQSTEMAMKMMSISEAATAAGNYGAGGMAKFKDGQWLVASEKDQAGWAAAKVKNLESQKRQTSIHPDSMYEYYYDDKGDKQILDLSSSGMEIAMTFTEGDVKESRRSRDDNKQGMRELYRMLQEGKAPARFKEAIEQNSKVKEYAKEIAEMYGKPADTTGATVAPGTGTGAGAVGSMSSGASGVPVALPPTSVGNGPRKRT